MGSTTGGLANPWETDPVPPAAGPAWAVLVGVAAAGLLGWPGAATPARADEPPPAGGVDPGADLPLPWGTAELPGLDTAVDTAEAEAARPAGADPDVFLDPPADPVVGVPRGAAPGGASAMNLSYEVRNGVVERRGEPAAAQLALADHLDDSPDELLDLLGREYPVSTADELRCAVVDVCERLRDLALGSTAVTPERAAERFPLPDEGGLAGLRRIPGYVEQLVQGVEDARDAAVRAPHGFFAPELLCVLVCSGDTARVVGGVQLGDAGEVGLPVPSPAEQPGATGSVVLHTHPLRSWTTAGLSAADLDIVTTARSGSQGDADPLGIASIELLSDTVVLALSESEARPLRLEILPGRSGVVTDEIRFDSGGPAVPLTPLPGRIEPVGTSDRRTAALEAAEQPTAEDTAAALDSAAEHARFLGDVRRSVLARGGSDAPAAPGPDTGSDAAPSTDGAAPDGTAERGGGTGAGVVIEPRLPGPIPLLEPGPRLGGPTPGPPVEPAERPVPRIDPRIDPIPPFDDRNDIADRVVPPRERGAGDPRAGSFTFPDLPLVGDDEPAATDDPRTVVLPDGRRFPLVRRPDGSWRGTVTHPDGTVVDVVVNGGPTAPDATDVGGAVRDAGRALWERLGREVLAAVPRPSGQEGVRAHLVNGDVADYDATGRRVGGSAAAPEVLAPWTTPTVDGALSELGWVLRLLPGADRDRGVGLLTP